MEKNEFPKKESIVKPKTAGFSQRIFGIVKFALGIFLLPFVYAATIAFLKELGALETAIKHYFFGGLISFVIIYLFIYEPVIIYNKGQKILEAVFRYFSPLVKVAPYLLPIYTIILFLIYGLYSIISKSAEPMKYFALLFGFSIGLHLTFSAKSLRSRQNDFLKANYIFGFSFIYIINLIILAFGLSLIFSSFSFVNFCNNSFQIAANLFGALFKQLFL